MKVAISSLDQVWKNKSANRVLCENDCMQANASHADLIIFPEMTLTGFCMDAQSLAENAECSETIIFFQSLALKYDLAVVFGFIAEDNGYFNRAIAVSSQGQVVSQYDKIHPFVDAGEDQIFTGGSLLSVFNISDFTVGLTVCYDLRFPEIYTALSRDCDLVINIANWPEKRCEHWDTLLRARAIESQFYMLGVNRTGKDGNGVDYSKSSKCYHPSGQAMPFVSMSSSLDTLDLDKLSLSQFRQGFPTLSSRREALYAQFRR